MERRAIYDIINKLIEKGLITYTVEQGKRTYQVAPPNKLKEEANKKIEELKKFQSIVPGIEEIYKESKPKMNIEIFKGKEGIFSVWEDMLNHKDVYWIGSGRYVPIKYPIWFKHWNERRIKAKTKWINLLRYEMKKNFKLLKLESAKFLPKEFSGNPTVIGIYGNKVVNFTFTEDLFAFMIENKEIAENYKKYHKYLWKNIAKK